MDKYGKKDFKGWIKLKEKIHYRKRVCSFKTGEIWWSSIGENVGSEICGKGKTYTRPILIFKKLDKYSFWAIPLTSKPHTGSWYIHFEFGGKKQIAVLSQIENMSASRLQRKIGQISNLDFEYVYKGFLRLLK